jgi:hypothetical protein
MRPAFRQEACAVLLSVGVPDERDRISTGTVTQHQWWYRFRDDVQLVVLEPDGSRKGEYGSHWFVASVNW